MNQALVLGIILQIVNGDVIDLLGQAYNPFYPPIQVAYPTIIDTTSPLPEIIINRQARPLDPRSNRKGGYIINRPSIPFNPTQRPQADVEIHNEYLPPVQDQPNNGYLPPPNTQTTPLPPFQDEELDYDPPDNSYLPPASGPYNQRNAKDINFFRSTSNALSNMKVELKDMKCLQNPNGFLRAQLQMHNIVDAFPVMDQDISDPRCEIRTLRKQVLVNIVSEDFDRCGVYNCGNDLCVRIRFPLIRGLRTRDDLGLTLQCKVQERVVGKVHTIKIGVSNGVQGRSSGGAVAHGGSGQQFRTQVGLFRRADENGFTQALQPGDSVQLGEELMLRAQARSGDGEFEF